MPRNTVLGAGDFWSGILLAGLALGFGLVSVSYDLGRPTRMGPGFFPLVLAAVLLLIGLATAARSFLRGGPPVDELTLRPIVLVLGGVVGFGVLLQGAGLAAALVVVVLVSARASFRFRWRSAILLAGAVSALSILVFAIALQLPVPVLGRWLAG